MSDAQHSRGEKALELTMRDVLDAMEELACEQAYTPLGEGADWHILGIEAPSASTTAYRAHPTAGRAALALVRRAGRACA